MFKKSLLAASLALAAAGAQASVVVNIDFDGLGALESSTAIRSLDWSPNSVLVTAMPGENVNNPYLGQVVQTYIQGSLGSTIAGNGSVFNPFGLNANNVLGYEWTFVGAFQEVIAGVQGGINPGDGTVTLQTIAGGNNFFEVWVSAKDSNALAGTGYANGVKILSGSIDVYDAVADKGKTSFTTTAGTAIVPLDGSGTDNYAGKMSVTGSGTGDVNLTVSYVDNNYFTNLNVGDLVNIFLQTNLGLPFGQVDPSALVAGQAAVSTVGTVNGIDGPNLMLQSDAASNFETKRIPEPASAALVGLAMAGLGISRRRSAK